MYFKLFLLALLIAVATAARMPRSSMTKVLSVRGGEDADKSDLALKAGTIWHLGYGLAAILVPSKVNERNYGKDFESDDAKANMRFAGIFCSLVGLMGQKLPKADAFKFFTLSTFSCFLMGLKFHQDEVFTDKVGIGLAGVMAAVMGFFAKKEKSE